MSAAPDNLERFGPEWCNRRVAVIHGQDDTRIKTGEDYDSRTLGSLFTMEPGNVEKSRGLAVIPSTYHDYDARTHKVQETRGSFVALVGDIDHGDHPRSKIESLVHGFARDCAFLIYSTASAQAGDMRWRVIIPLEKELSFAEWYDAQSAFFDFMDEHGVEMDRALSRPGQFVYLPNVPPELRGKDGSPLYYERATSGTNAPALDLGQGVPAHYITEIRKKRAADERARQRIRKEAEERRANSPPREGANIIEEFNRANSIETLLELYNYERSPRNSDDWRSPKQTSGSYATRVFGDKWVSLSGSDAGARIGETHKLGCFGDAYDLFVHYEHGGDHKAAFRALYQERRASMHIPHGEPPPPQPDDPGPEPIEDVGDNEPDVEARDENAGPALPFFWFHEARPNLDANDFVEGLLTSSAMSVVYGASNCGKTFFIVDLALHVAMGREWRGRAVDRGAIVYLSLEGAQGIRNRLAAFRQHHGLDGESLPFVAMPKPINLLDQAADVNAVIELTLHVADETGMGVAMVIVDTLSRAMAGGNENSPEDMTALIGNCDRIRDATGAHVCIIHHSGKDEARGARGHSSLRAATDTEIEIKRDPELTVSSVRVAKQRDLEAADPFAFTLQSVSLGLNRRGKPVTSCVVVEAEHEVVLARDPNKLSPKESQALDSLERCLAAASFEFAPEPDGETVAAVTLHAWKRSMQALNIIAEAENIARPQFHRIKKALETKGYVGVKGGDVWRA